MSQALQATIARQRMQLYGRLSSIFARLRTQCVARWGDTDALEALLRETMQTLPYCKYLYVLDERGRQITANATPAGLLPAHRGRDRSARPYMAEALAGADFSLSPAYLSRNKRRPSLTAVHRLTTDDGRLRGFLGADFDLRDLPLTRALYRQPDQWLQLKGDPAIRGALFQQQRVESLMDGRIDEVLDLITELVLAHGVFHGKLHFSSSRATLWLLDDPYRYRVLDFEDLNDPATCLAYPRRDYAAEAVIPAERVPEIFRHFRALRFMDENIYLRSGSLNVFNGMVSLNFSCDGSHYMRWDELLDKRMDFWLGTGPTCETPEPPERGAA
ncbi:MAG: PDC sensor domain-containing protein [Thiohalocapsa sp.]|nr:PDC sensor domain-containing protein [Thiohalocapsa sp.]MCF7993158.1 PDC sensor domain-containing protein [Thiohalocapsa sp.]